MSIRIDNCLKKMLEANLDGVLYAQGANFQYLSECTSYFWQRHSLNNIMGRFSAKVLPEVLIYMNKEGKRTILSIPQYRNHFEGYDVVISYMDQWEDTLSKIIDGKRIGVGFDCFEYLEATLKEVSKEIEVVDAEELFFDLRACKDEVEIAQMRKLAKFTDDAVMYVVQNLKEGMTQYDAEKLLMDYGMIHGVQDFSFSPTCGFKTRGTFTPEQNFEFPRDSKLVKGTGIAFDVGFMDNGYCSDWGRTVYFGKAPERVKKAYEALQAGQEYMVSKIVPNQTNVNELFDLVYEEVNRRGFGDVLRHKELGMLGHQIGIDCHEMPLLKRDVDAVLRPGMIFCSEPKIMIEGECFMRVEDMILITETGVEFLTNFDRTLFEVGND